MVLLVKPPKHLRNKLNNFLWKFSENRRRKNISEVIYQGQNYPDNQNQEEKNYKKRKLHIKGTQSPPKNFSKSYPEYIKK